MIRESITDYHAHTAISHSKLETFRRRPALYHKKYITKTLPKEAASASFRVGSAVHCAVLEPDEFCNRYTWKPDTIDRRTKEGKERWANFEMQNLGKTIIDQDEWAEVAKIGSAVFDHPLASQLLDQGEAELTWRTDAKIPLQCRTDWFSREGCELSEGRPYIADLKTVESLEEADFGSFDRAVFKYGYHRQAGFYLPLITEIIGSPVFDFFFIAVEKVEPYGVAVYKLTDDAVAIGQDETVFDLRRLIMCLERDEWPNIEPKLRPLGVPAWYRGGAS